jgi:hypothetical protein
MIKTILFAIAITQLIGGLSVLLFKYNISIRGIYWGSESFEVNIYQIIISILIILYIIYSEISRQP